MNPVMNILAQSVYNDRLKSLRGAFNENGGDSGDIGKLFFFGALVMVLLIALVVARRAAQKEGSKPGATKPLKLFSKVLKEMGTPFPVRCLMRAAARQSRLRQPVVMFFNPDLFERYAGRWADTLVVRSLRPYARKRVSLVAKKAFPWLDHGHD